ncbi:hypothetical protein IQ256_26910 [cf. Phormidesmis sp. LEGE 11477]|nr:hypothetical protein [cf. Phormidesmis sp. LEGE 11477]
MSEQNQELLTEILALSTDDAIDQIDTESRSMESRCDAASEAFASTLRTAAKEGFDYVELLPMYSSDFDRRPSLGRPSTVEVSSEMFQELIWQIADAGFDCFVDRPNKLELKDFGILNWSEQQVEWSLYILLPFKKPPAFSIWRFLMYDKELSDFNIVETVEFAPSCAIRLFFSALCLGTMTLISEFWPNVKNEVIWFPLYSAMAVIVIFSLAIVLAKIREGDFS